MPRPPRILYVSLADLSRPNGPGVNETEFLLSLQEKFGHHAHALIPHPRAPLPDFGNVVLTTYRQSPWTNPFGQLQSQVDLFLKLRRILRDERFDFAVLRLSLFPLAIALHRKTLPPYFAKSLGEIQGFTRNSGFKGAVARCMAPLNLALFKWVIRHSGGVDCCTPNLAAQHRSILRLADEKIEIVENATNVVKFSGVDRQQAKEDLNLIDRFPILGFVGGHPDQRGGSHIVRAVARLRHELPHIHGVIVGLDAGDRLKGLARQLGVLDRIMLTGQIPYEKVPAHVAAFDIGFALDDSQRALATGNSYQKVRQYLSAGLRVITQGEGLEFLSERGLVDLVDSNGTEEICENVRAFAAATDGDRAAHRERAIRFATENLSTTATLERRLAFWRRRTQANGPVVDFSASHHTEPVSANESAA